MLKEQFGFWLATVLGIQNLNAGGIMGILILKVLATWSLIGTLAGLSLGFAIRKGDQVRKDVFLSSVFASLETQQGSLG